MNRTKTKDKSKIETVASQSGFLPESPQTAEKTNVITRAFHKLRGFLFKSPQTAETEIERDESNIEGLKQEYTEVNNTFRHYSLLRFSIFTVFLVALGGLASVSFGFIEFKYGDPDEIRLWGRIGGFIVTLLFFHYELRIQYLLDHSLKVGTDIEKILKYKHLSTREERDNVSIIYYTTNIFFVILIGQTHLNFNWQE